jgi:hypothetical protein
MLKYRLTQINKDKLFFADVLLYNIDTSEITHLADGQFFLNPYIQNGFISLDGNLIAFINYPQE